MPPDVTCLPSAPDSGLGSNNTSPEKPSWPSHIKSLQPYSLFLILLGFTFFLRIYHSIPLGLTVCILSFLTRMSVPWKGPWPCSISFFISCVTSTFKKCSVKSIIISFSYIFKACGVGGGACEEMDLFLSKCPCIIWWQEPDRPDVIRQVIFQFLWDQWCVIPPCLSQYFKTRVTQLFKPLHHLHQFFLLTHITCDPPNSSEF